MTLVMDGIESTRRYRQFEAKQGTAKRLIIIGMSANSDTVAANEAISSGMDGFIGKPFNYKAFENILLVIVKIKNSILNSSSL